MGIEHKHALICERSKPICRFMELYAEGYMLDEEDGHRLVSELFKRINDYKEEEIKKYNLNSWKRQSNVRFYHGINPTEPPTDHEEYLIKQMKLYQKREEMKRRKSAGENCQSGKRQASDNGWETTKKRQRNCDAGESVNSDKGCQNGATSGERHTANGER